MTSSAVPLKRFEELFEHAVRAKPDDAAFVIKALYSLQNPGTGLFHESSGDFVEATALALRALRALNASPAHRLRVTPFEKESALEKWLEGLDWVHPWRATDRIECLLEIFIHRVEVDRSPVAAGLYHRVLDWLDQRQDPDTALWGHAADPAYATEAAKKIANLYAYVHRPVLGSIKLGVAASLSAGRGSLNAVWMREPTGGAARFHPGAEVAVVVTCFNLGAYLFDALDSVGRQTLSEVDLIIVDDGSTDAYTVAYLDFLASRGYRVIRQQNTGLATARNNGIRAVSARLICCFDADDRMHPAWLKRAKDTIEADPGLGFVSCYYRCFDNDHADYRYTGVNLPEMLVSNQAAVLSLFRRDAWDRVGGYCPEFSTGMEDWDFWISILAVGYRATSIPEVLFYYRARECSMLSVAQRPENYKKNARLLLERHRAVFEAHWPEVILLRARQFADLLATRSEEVRYTTRLERRIADADRELGELRTWRIALQPMAEHPDMALRIAGAIRTAALLLNPARLTHVLKNLVLLWRVQRSAAALQKWQELFDREYYLSANVDVLVSGVLPELHYTLQGGTEGRNPSLDFDGRFYLRRHPDVAGAGFNPLLHFVLFGSAERRIAAPVRPQGAARDRRVPFPPPDLEPVSRPLIAVVIPCFNYGRYLREVVRSVEAQTFRNFEIVVVEGGSTDGTTPEQVRQVEGEGIQNTRFFYRTEPHLAGDNRNFGIQQSRAPYICCLDADDLLRPIYLECAAFVAETYRYDIVASAVAGFGDGTFLWNGGPPELEEMKDHNQIATAALFRKEAWRASGGFRDWGRGHTHVAEDWDLWLRLLAKGYSAANLSAPLLLHRVHGGSLSQTATKSTGEQKQAILEANRNVLAAPQDAPEPPAHFFHPWENLLADAPTQRTVLLAFPYLTIGGAEAQFATIIRGLLAHGIRVVMITTELLPATMTDETSRFELLTPYVYPLPMLFEWDTGRWTDFLLFLIARYRPETLLNVGSNFIYTSLPCLKRVVPALKIADQLFNDGDHFESSRKYTSYIDATITMSELLSAKLAGSGVDRAKITAIPNAIEVPDAGPQEEPFDSDFFPASFAGKAIVSFFGRLSAEKAPLDFIAIAEALRHRDDVRFFIAGEGPEREAVRKRIAQLGLTQRVFAPGAVKEVARLMRQSAVVVLTSHLDGMPTVVLEAQALERPVVASAVGSVPTMIEDSRTGFLCAPGDIQAFAARIIELVDAPEMRARLGKAGREFVREHFTAEKMVERYVKVLNALRIVSP